MLRTIDECFFQIQNGANIKQGEDIEDMLQNCDKKVMKEFGLSEKMLKNVISKLTNKEITRLNFLLMYTKEIMKDKTINGFRNAVNNLGRINRNEVVTPDSLVKRMIEKLDKDVYEKANSILVVNDKYGEFTFGLAKKFGNNIQFGSGWWFNDQLIGTWVEGI